MGNYQICLAEKGTGAQGLKVGTIYDMNKYQLVNKKDLIFTKGGKETQYGIILDLKTKDSDKKEFYNINVHLNGGKTDKDKKVRDEQLQNLLQALNEPPYRAKSNIILSGDFNTDIAEVKSFIETNFNLTAHLGSQGGNPLYNSENRVQFRNRDGQVGLDIIQRCVDGVFYQANDI